MHKKPFDVLMLVPLLFNVLSILQNTFRFLAQQWRVWMMNLQRKLKLPFFILPRFRFEAEISSLVTDPANGGASSESTNAGTFREKFSCLKQTILV